MKIFAVLVAIVCISGCARESYVILNTATPPLASYRVFDESRDAVWDASVLEFGKQSFVINNLDKASGSISLSYSGDPQRFIDCGNITSHVKDSKGERTYDFPSTKAQANYEVMAGDVLFNIVRKMSVEAHVSLVFKQVNPNQTEVTANTVYVVQKDVISRRADSNVSQSWSDSVTFSNRGAASFPNDVNSAATTVCKPTGELEREILAALK
ncbi:MAG TPA: hypothetical protein VMJ33_08145 [Gallionella sp.]|nr:hypothetical protein [Gallionella sp.]